MEMGRKVKVARMSARGPAAMCWGRDAVPADPAAVRRSGDVRMDPLHLPGGRLQVQELRNASAPVSEDVIRPPAPARPQRRGPAVPGLGVQ